MTLDQALLSGRPYRRIKSSEWREPNQVHLSLHVADILADDWEIKPIPRELTVYLSPDGKQITLEDPNNIHFLKLHMREVLND